MKKSEDVGHRTAYNTFKVRLITKYKKEGRNEMEYVDILIKF